MLSGMRAPRITEHNTWWAAGGRIPPISCILITGRRQLRLVAYSLAFCAVLIAQFAFSSFALAASIGEPDKFSGPMISGLPVEFMLFAAVLFFIAFVHVNTMVTAVTGAMVISVYKILFSPFSEGAGVEGLARHFSHEWITL